MEIMITGGTGFVGRALAARLLLAGHRVRVLTRSVTRGRTVLGDEVELTDQVSVEGCDAVINLAGEGIADGRWTSSRKRALVDSRVGLTRRIVSAIGAAKLRPRVLISASAVGFYGDGGEAELSEESPRGHGFLAELCEAWEREALRAGDQGARVVVVRLGVVLGRDGGALEKMLVPFRLGLGGRIGSGRQFMSWIHLADLVELLIRAISDGAMQGVYNGVAPEPVTNRALARALGRALGRPAVLPVPAPALRVLMGEAASVLLTSQRALPSRALEAGFTFRFPMLADALHDLLDTPSRRGGRADSTTAA